MCFPVYMYVEFLKPSVISLVCVAMNLRAGEIIKSHDGHYYRVLEASNVSVSLMRVNGQTIFACRPEYIDRNFSVPTPEAA